jgi:amino acid adenylation domain-containing protein
LTKRRLLDSAPECGARVLCVDEEWDAISNESGDNMRQGAVSSNLAYVTYTSGSTGKPKGIAMPQRAVRNLLEWQFRETDLPPGARTLQFASLSFDVSFQDMFSTWGMGGAVVLITEDERQNIGGLARVLQEKAIDRLFIPAVALQQLAEGFCALSSPSATLRKIIAGSEQLQITRPIATMFEELPACSLHNEYGPSETHVVTELALPASPGEWPERPCIGSPILNSQIYLLDRHMQPVPIGVPGELYIGGAGLARCYLNRQELVAEKFIPDPFGGEPGARLYRTGDLARWRPEGQIEFLGRIDFQIKIRGYRVELGEVEAALSAYPTVKEAVLIAREDQTGGKRLVAYLVTSSEGDTTVSQLRAFLRQKLPDYMAPSAFVFLDKLPLTPNGKVNRKALPAPDQSRPELERSYVAPRTALEEVLAQDWREVLNIERVGVHDNFFDLGGHSLLATRLMSRLQEDFQIDIPLRRLFEAPTVAGLAEAMGGEEMRADLENIAITLMELRGLSDEGAVALLNQDLELVQRMT